MKDSTESFKNLPANAKKRKLIPRDEGNSNNKDTVYFIGGSTMDGKGLRLSKITYPEIFSVITQQSIVIYIQYLIRIQDVVEIVQNDQLSGKLFLQCGAGDQLRTADPMLKLIFPEHWILPAHFDPPINFNRNQKKRIRQKIVMRIKFVLKYLIRLVGLYKNTTKLKDFILNIEKLAKLAHAQNLQVIWIDSLIGINIPNFIKKEKYIYCRGVIEKYLVQFPKSSEFISLEDFTEADAFDDSFHLNYLGHEKLGRILAEKFIARDLNS